MVIPLVISAECFVHMAHTLLFKPKDNLIVDQKMCLITNTELTSSAELPNQKVS